jgi:hypothetical protein
MGIAMASIGLQVLPDLLGLYAASHRTARRKKRNLDGHQALGALPSVS